jgi:hypothetical protein
MPLALWSVGERGGQDMGRNLPTHPHPRAGVRCR